jgi:heme/copper-type cytochrome/quinol oxidase subunit 2
MTLGIFIAVVVAGIVLLAVFRSRSNKNDQRRRDADSKH